MLLKYGTYAFNASACKVTTEAEMVYNQGGQPLAVRRRLHVDGYMDGDDQATITTNLAALDAALKVPYLDLILYGDDGTTESAIQLKNAGSITGVQIRQAMSLPVADGAMYVTTEKFVFSAEAEYPLAGTSGLLRSWVETLSLSGGGQLRDVFPCTNAPPQEQQLWPAMPYEAQQSGVIVGYRAYPTAPAPIFPAALTKAGSFSRKGPKRMGNGFQEYPLEYAYSFKSASPLVGLPNAWV